MAAVAQFHREPVALISGITTKSAVQVKPCPNYHLSLACLWQNTVFVIDYIAGLGLILPINKKTKLWNFIHYLLAHFHNC